MSIAVPQFPDPDPESAPEDLPLLKARPSPNPPTRLTPCAGPEALTLARVFDEGRVAPALIDDSWQILA